MSSSLLIQISSLRRNNNVFASAIYNALHLRSRYSNNRSKLRTSTMTGLARIVNACPTHQTRMPFYIIPCCQKNPASVENYASDLHPASFESGSDLLRSDGQPWLPPLYALPKYHSPLYDKLREEQFVPDDLDAALSTLPSKNLSYRRSHFLYTLNDTFFVDFSSSVEIIRRDRTRRLGSNTIRRFS
jgi:hypothetical protein